MHTLYFRAPFCGLCCTVSRQGCQMSLWMSGSLNQSKFTVAINIEALIIKVREVN